MPDLLYALAFNVQGQVFRSLNGGASWKRTAWIRDFVYDLACDPRRPDTAYVLWMNGVYKTSDRGATWTKHHFPSPHYSFGRIAVSPKNSEVLYATGICVTSSTTWTTCMAVFKSTTGGRTWSVKTVIPGSSGGQARALAVAPSRPQILYVGGWYTTDRYHDGLFKSVDGGTTWKEITGAIEEEPKAIAVDPADFDRVYVGTDAGVFTSSDGGASWAKAAGIPGATALIIDPANRAAIYAGNGAALYRSTDAGAHWTALPSTAYGSVACLSLSSGRMLYGASGGLYRSGDGGATWTASHAGIRAARMEAPAVSDAAPGTLYGIVPSQGLMKSSDDGATWSKLPDFKRSRGVTRIVLHPTNPKIMYSLGTGPFVPPAVGAGPLPSVYRTVDGGSTWERVLTAKVSDLEMSRTHPSRVFAGGLFRRPLSTFEEMCVFRTLNGGGVWDCWAVYPAPASHVYDLAVDPEDDRVVYLGGDQGVYTKVFFKSTDRGRTWTNLSSALAGAPVGRLVFDPSDARRMYNVHSAGTYRSEDGGLSWTKLEAVDFQPESLVVDPDDPKVLYAAGYAGVRRSSDRGATWADLTENLPVKYVLGLSLDPVRRILYAGTNGASVYKKPL
jgi:photosystem II stability/assembly factor-like uncharacterized protein